MTMKVILFVIASASVVMATASDSFLRCISCPCGSGSKNYTHCMNESLFEDISCDRWSHCQTCKTNITSCITCPEDRFGPICSENKNIQSKRQEEPALVNYRRYRRQSDSETRCLNHGPISNGRVIVILPFYARSGPFLEEEEEFDLPLGTRLKYECYPGFRLVGEPISRCGSTGYWTEPIPECKN